MSRFEFNLATPRDDAGLRALLAATPMEGSISVAFAREPSYFDAAAVDGKFLQVVTVRQRESGNIIGMGSRATGSYYVNGQVVDIGYLSALRLLAKYRGQAGILARGYRFFRKLHRDSRAPFYLTTIAEGNAAAIRLLTSQRAGLPVYHPLGRYHTLSFAAKTRLPAATRGAVKIRTATSADGEGVARFLRREGPLRQFFPALETSEFFERPEKMLGLRAQDILLATQEDTIVGTWGVWDQRRFKQTIIHSYPTWLRIARPVYNTIAALRGKPRLPGVGHPLNLRYAAIPVVAKNDPQVARRLLRAAIALLREQRAELLLMGLHERDPLLPCFREFSGREYVTRLFLVYWPDQRPDIQALTRRVPYLELGCL